MTNETDDFLKAMMVAAAIRDEEWEAFETLTESLDESGWDQVLECVVRDLDERGAGLVLGMGGTSPEGRRTAMELAETVDCFETAVYLLDAATTEQEAHAAALALPLDFRARVRETAAAMGDRDKVLACLDRVALAQVAGESDHDDAPAARRTM
jgi:hypothetical protein